MKQRLIILLLISLITTSALSAFTLNFTVSFGNGNFQTLDLTPTNGINVSVISFNSFTPVIGATSFSDIIGNSTILASGTTVTDLLTNVGTLGITQGNLETFSGDELFVFANFNNLEFGLWRDISGGTNWIGGVGFDNLVSVTLDPNATITAFAGSFNDANNSFILEVVPEPSTYALMALGGLALIVGYGRGRKKK